MHAIQQMFQELLSIFIEMSLQFDKKKIQQLNFGLKGKKINISNRKKKKIKKLQQKFHHTGAIF